MLKITNEPSGSAGAMLPDLNQELIRERIDYLHRNTDFALTLFDKLNMYAIVALDFDGNIIAFNEGAQRAFGYTPEEVVGRQRIDMLFSPEFVEDGRMQQANTVVLRDQPFVYDGDMLKKDEQRFPVHALLIVTKDLGGQIVGFILLAEDISERKQAQAKIEKLNAELEQRVLERTAELHASEERFRSAIETARDAIISIDGSSGWVTAWNLAAEAMFGYSSQEACGRVLHDFLTPARFRAAAAQGMAHFASSGGGAVIGKTSEMIALCRDGTELPIELSLSALQLEGLWHATGIARDISERRLRDAQIKRLNKTLRTLSTCNMTLVRSQSEQELFRNVCRHIVEIGEYRLAFVGIGHDDAAKTIQIAAQHGAKKGYLESLGLSSADTNQRQSPLGSVICSGVPQLSQNIMNDFSLGDWREVANKLGINSSIVLPLKMEDEDRQATTAPIALPLRDARNLAKLKTRPSVVAVALCS